MKAASRAGSPSSLPWAARTLGTACLPPKLTDGAPRLPSRGSLALQRLSLRGWALDHLASSFPCTSTRTLLCKGRVLLPGHAGHLVGTGGAIATVMPVTCRLGWRQCLVELCAARLPLLALSGEHLPVSRPSSAAAQSGLCESAGHGAVAMGLPSPSTGSGTREALTHHRATARTGVQEGLRQTAGVPVPPCPLADATNIPEKQDTHQASLSTGLDAQGGTALLPRDCQHRTQYQPASHQEDP